MSHTVHAFQLGTVALEVASDVVEVLDDYTAMYRPYQVNQSPPGALAFELIYRKPRRFSPGQYVVRYDGNEYETGSMVRSALPGLERCINLQVMIQRTDFLQVHAGVVTRDGAGVICPAVSGTGKSTLTTALIRRGWQYLCDEFALIGPGSMVVHPFPKALCLKEGSLKYLDRWGIEPHSPEPYLMAGKYERYYLPAHYIRPGAVGAPSPIRWLFFLQRDEQNGFDLQPLPTGEAAMLLYEQGFNTIAHRAGGFKCAIDLAGRAKCHKMSLADPDETCDKLEEFLDQQEILAQSVA